ADGEFFHKGGQERWDRLALLKHARLTPSSQEVTALSLFSVCARRASSRDIARLKTNCTNCDKQEKTMNSFRSSAALQKKIIMKHLFAFLALPAFAISLHADCTLTRTGKIPLNESTVPYQNTQGGLYPNGVNNRPTAHLNAGLQIAGNLRPLNAAGQVDDTNGKIVLVSVGMSNTTQEWAIGDDVTRDFTRAFK